MLPSSFYTVEDIPTDLNGTVLACAFGIGAKRVESCVFGGVKVRVDERMDKSRWLILP